MPLHVLLLVVASAAVHVAWNVAARSARGSARFAWLVNVAGTAILLPGFLARRFTTPLQFDGHGATLLGLAAWSALFEAAYFILLHKAYDATELSIVYPLSRGVAPLFALVPARLWTGDGVTTRELLGIAVVVAGAACIASTRLRVAAGSDATAVALARAHARRGVWLALLTGAATAAYQLVDRKAMQLVARGSELDYLFEMQLALTALLTGWWWSRRAEEAPTPSIAPPPIPLRRAELRRAILAAIAIQLAYYLVLLALRDGNVTLVAAARNVGIPLSLFAGWYFLKEHVGPRRMLGATLIVAGVLLSLEP